MIQFKYEKNIDLLIVFSEFNSFSVVVVVL